MKKNFAKVSLIVMFIIGSLGFSTGKPDRPVKNSAADLPVAKSDKTKLTADRVKQIVIARIPGANLSHINEFKSEGEVYKGAVSFNGTRYEFEIDAYTGRAIKWNALK